MFRGISGKHHLLFFILKSRYFADPKKQLNRIHSIDGRPEIIYRVEYIYINVPQIRNCSDTTRIAPEDRILTGWIPAGENSGCLIRSFQSSGILRDKRILCRTLTNLR
jgi:hypothetical protein